MQTGKKENLFGTTIQNNSFDVDGSESVCVCERCHSAAQVMHYSGSVYQLQNLEEVHYQYRSQKGSTFHMVAKNICVLAAAQPHTTNHKP